MVIAIGIGALAAFVVATVAWACAETAAARKGRGA